ncbi:hypothetical protein LSCM1_02267 [Leishmania martiniquensis]|uniref:Uncharacterized protein n=1 Tax=Leishmania martiniquensis TaxID=1580590 RepID=A0A836GQU7_9TRYP|nr:hypothetical protein LSCM1_02267 [Leishmania martiniquensis]
MGLGTRSCMVFCYLNALCAVLISYLFKIGINSMAIASAIHKWDRQEKARACRNAGILYFIAAVAATVKDVIDTYRERRASRSADQRMVEYGMMDRSACSAEAIPLLDRRAYVHGEGTHHRNVARGGGSGNGSGGYGGTL